MPLIGFNLVPGNLSPLTKLSQRGNRPAKYNLSMG